MSKTGVGRFTCSLSVSPGVSCKKSSKLIYQCTVLRISILIRPQALTQHIYSYFPCPHYPTSRLHLARFVVPFSLSLLVPVAKQVAALNRQVLSTTQPKRQCMRNIGCDSMN